MASPPQRRAQGPMASGPAGQRGRAAPLPLKPPPGLQENFNPWLFPDQVFRFFICLVLVLVLVLDSSIVPCGTDAAESP